MTRILVVGDVVDDIVVRPLGSVNTASDTDAEIRRTAGGSAANVAAWLGHLGADARFVGRAGVEGAARHRAALSAYGVDARVTADPDTETATIVLNLDPAGERTMFVDRAANARLSPGDLPPSVLEGVGWLHLTGYSFFDDAVRPAVLDLQQRARGAGCGVSVDPSSAGFLARCGADTFLEWVGGADVLLPNLLEGRFLTGLSEPDDVAAALAERFPAVVLTLGAEGALLASAGSSTRVRAEPAVVVDTTGAGDAFAAGFLSVWTSEADPAAALAAGARASAQAISVLGARPGG
ncbi:sugar kinase [Nocardioides sp.]|uniref:carbohydrate kinase family protein n=1 Tax=Nocardioides sp. TaxID=35761 RepID=UPI002ED0DDA5